MEHRTIHHFERHDPARNMHRFYRLEVTRDLFGTVLLLREWGRIGMWRRQRAEAAGSLAEACRLAEALAARKCRRGYVEAGA